MNVRKTISISGMISLRESQILLNIYSPHLYARLEVLFPLRLTEIKYQVKRAPQTQ